jgi:WD40 repeat protein
VLWDYNKSKAIYKFNDNAEKTHASLSPDGKYVVSGDENAHAFVWDSHTGERLFRVYDLALGRYLEGAKVKGKYYDPTGVIKQPKDFCFKYSKRGCIEKDNIFAMKFINNDQYLRFTTYVNYAILYDVTNPNHKKYFKLEGHPDVYGYNEAATTDTAPEVGLLVMGTNISEGIRVYQYDRKKETLKLVWAPDKIQRTLWQRLLW